MITSPSISNLAEALAKAQGEMKNPEKNKTATIPMKSGGKYSYNYADLPSTIDCVRSALSKNGLSHVSSLNFGDKGLYLSMRLIHSSGEWIESEYGLPNNLDDKAIASSMTYGRRYLFIALVGVAADDDLDDQPENDGVKYENRDVVQKGKPQVAIKTNPDASDLESLKVLIKSKGWSAEMVNKYLPKTYGCFRVGSLTTAEFNELFDHIANNPVTNVVDIGKEFMSQPSSITQEPA